MLPGMELRKATGGRSSFDGRVMFRLCQNLCSQLNRSQIMTVDADYTKLVAWSKVDGTYALAGVYDKPSSSGDLRGLMLHLGLPIVYVGHPRFVGAFLTS
ncbi:hypothetical protein Esi_0055_0080 [Ectocarpus siliculosus]|uniref:Uncharacterized protein n=1 Tax=Ectocarpus siliculosus TaxID=2880 RepID=D7G499_ECTSI|nr:hypothetical protein Esi_0055_0080 [Ectocarpus siliculosus]|eukprot:CBJ27114.1 hypothetical protein Esi_0055_0080 [Ectocarpus siliculosus]